MKKIPSVVIGLFSVILQMSCSIKEDRSVCPCRLNLDLGSIDTSLVCEIELNLATTDGYLFSKRLHKSEFDTKTYLVPKACLSVMILAEADNFYEPGVGLVIPLGEECPPLYSYSALISTRAEVVEESIILRKNYCNVFIEFVDIENFNYDLTMRGNVRGYALDGKQLPGLFEVSMDTSHKEAYSVRIPRQDDSSLIMIIGDEGALYKSFALGEYIVASGYDWSAPDLSDIVVRIDYSRTDLSVSVQPWEKSEEIETII